MASTFVISPSKGELLKHRYPKDSLKQKYMLLNFVLILLVGIAILFRLFLDAVIFLNLVPQLASIGIFVAAINTIILAMLIWVLVLLLKFDVRGYMILMALSVISMLGIVNSDIITLVIVILTLVLPFFLKYKLFPGIPLFRFLPNK